MRICVVSQLGLKPGTAVSFAKMDPLGGEQTL